MGFKTIRDFDVKNKIVLLRADLNVPVQDGRVTDTTRIDRLRPTLDYLRAHGAKTVVLSHFGRPKGKAVPEFSLRNLIPALEKSWSCAVAFAPDCVGDAAQGKVDALAGGDVLLLENVRFHAGEEGNDPAFVAALTRLGEIYINDAFSAAHRAHASTEGLAHHLPSGAGLLMEAELDALSTALENPHRPVVAIVGGAKISTKLSVLDNLVRKVDVLFLGGGMANTFLAAQGVEVGTSLCEHDMAEEARKIMATAGAAHCTIMLPADRVIVEKFGENAPHEVVETNAMPANREAVDIGPGTVAALRAVLSGAKTVLWNGPLGVFEVKPFNAGTDAVAQLVAGFTQNGTLVSVAGGGDTVAALEQAGVAAEFTYVSTAGGAFLEWLEGKTLPGVAALSAGKILV